MHTRRLSVRSSVILFIVRSQTSTYTDKNSIYAFRICHGYFTLFDNIFSMCTISYVYGWVLGSYDSLSLYSVVGTMIPSTNSSHCDCVCQCMFLEFEGCSGIHHEGCVCVCYRYSECLTCELPLLCEAYQSEWVTAVLVCAVSVVQVDAFIAFGKWNLQQHEVDTSYQNSALVCQFPLGVWTIILITVAPSHTHNHFDTLFDGFQLTLADVADVRVPVQHTDIRYLCIIIKWVIFIL